jgi:hypothetical protein
VRADDPLWSSWQPSVVLGGDVPIDLGREPGSAWCARPVRTDRCSCEPVTRAGPVFMSRPAWLALIGWPVSAGLDPLIARSVAPSSLGSGGRSSIVLHRRRRFGRRGALRGARRQWGVRMPRSDRSLQLTGSSRPEPRRRSLPPLRRSARRGAPARSRPLLPRGRARHRRCRTAPVPRSRRTRSSALRGEDSQPPRLEEGGELG